MVFCVHVIFKHIASVRWGILMQVEAHQYMCSQIFTARKVIFSEACVKNSVHKGGLPQCMLGPPRNRPPRPGTHPQSRHPRTRYPSWVRTPSLDQATPGSRHPPGADTPRSSACWEIRSTSGRYASYWNAILWQIFLCYLK